MKYHLRAPVKNEEAYEVFNLSWTELAKELESLRKHCSENKNPEYNVDEVIITPSNTLTGKQIDYLTNLLETEKQYDDEMVNPEVIAFRQRILTTLAKAKTSAT